MVQCFAVFQVSRDVPDRSFKCLPSREHPNPGALSVSHGCNGNESVELGLLLRDDVSGPEEHVFRRGGMDMDSC